MMRKTRVTDTQFTQAVYRHYYGESLTAIAKDFGIGQSTLSELRERRRSEWNDIRSRIIDAEIARLESDKTPAPDAKTRTYLTALLKLLITTDKTENELILDFCKAMDCTQTEAKTYIQIFEALLPLKITP